MTRAPYPLWAPVYLSLGWSPIPLPYGEKWPPPDQPHSFTGASGLDVTETQMRAWCGPRGRVKAGNLIYPPGNIALRMPRGIRVEDGSDGVGLEVLAIDVDAYSGKAGAETLSKAEAEWGKLPPTWVSANRVGSPLSGHRFYLVPGGLKWPGQVGPGIELLRWDHRFAICAPSLNPDSKEFYFWRDPDGNVVALHDLDPDAEVEVELPAPEDLPLLPAGWVEGLTSGGTAWGGKALDGGELPESEVRAWLAARDGGADLPVCSTLGATLTRYQRAVRKASDDGGAHDAARDGAWALIGDAAAGHRGVGRALPALRRTFLEAVRARRTTRVAAGEWKRIVIRGVSKVAAEGTPETEDVCGTLSGGGSSGSREGGLDRGVERKGRGGSATFDYKRDDTGNAQRLARQMDGNAAWVSALGGWHIWNPRIGVWELDVDSLLMSRSVMGMVRDMEAEAEFIEDPKHKSEFLKFVRSCGNVARIDSALKAFRSLDGVSVPAGSFDAAARLLNCPNGVVELNSDGVAFRPALRSDYSTISTDTRYVPEAENDEWEKFLELFLPDIGVRAWAQKMAGYALLGANPARVLVICKGKTSTGKTTFAEALRRTLGGYAGPYSVSMFRDNQDERPRVDIVQALPRRLIVAEETSSAWVLHTDQIKRATSGGVWAARGLWGKAYVERVPAFTPWIATNNVPTINGADAALRRRLRAVPFLVQVDADAEDVFFGDKLAIPEAREAILAWAVKGWSLWLEDEMLTDMPAPAAQMLMEIFADLSELDTCLSEICEFGDGWSKLTDLYEAYLHWMREHGTEKDIMSANKFGRALSEKGYERDQLWDAETQRNCRIRRGLRLRDGWARIGGTDR